MWKRGARGTLFVPACESLTRLRFSPFSNAIRWFIVCADGIRNETGLPSMKAERVTILHGLGCMLYLSFVVRRIQQRTKSLLVRCNVT